MGFLVLEDGTVFEGHIFGKNQKVIGEVVFNTGMTGYQEIMTDPSYYGQIVVMTFPLIGNYGINEKDIESARPAVRALVVQEACSTPSHWMSRETIGEYLTRYNITAIEGIDTRVLTRKIRDKGTMKGMITPEKPTSEDMLLLKEFFLYRPVDHVTTKQAYTIPGNGYHIAVVDFGVKQNILRSLSKRGCKMTVFPSTTKAEDILKYEPDGILLTNGPGDPRDNTEAIETIKVLINHKPIFGICLGHQLLALASGADTEKMKFGHRGCNHPVKSLESGRTYITSQNHGYTVTESSVDTRKMKVTFRNINDGTIEGLSYVERPAFSVQFHPEASPGPGDTGFLFDEFLVMINEYKHLQALY